MLLFLLLCFKLIKCQQDVSIFKLDNKTFARSFVYAELEYGHIEKKTYIICINENRNMISIFM